MGGATGLGGPLAVLLRDAPEHDELEVLLLEAEGDELAPEAGAYGRQQQHAAVDEASLLDAKDTAWNQSYAKSWYLHNGP